ncbi:hypothetical protein GQ53DRAFT_824873 [Thozetella sp. PMI_491]|nr:hypothetical protein GQ53DRAFT_824873 [Thozetella sp. PMI_491]
MARYVDTLPTPEKVQEVKVVVLSCSRNGTMGLFTALQTLGYKPYHVAEILKNGRPHMDMATQAIRGARTGQGRYSKADYDKWLGKYDAIVEIACFDLLEDILCCYPDAKFVLTTREPRAWMSSMNNTIVAAMKSQQEFPNNFLQNFDKLFNSLGQLSNTWVDVFFPSGDMNDEQSAMQKYEAYNKRVRELVPPEKLLDIRLEDGLGWEQLCPFLGHEIPDVPYPRINDAAQFTARRKMLQRICQIKAIANIAAVTVPPLLGAASFWWYLQRK